MNFLNFPMKDWRKIGEKFNVQIIWNIFVIRIYYYLENLLETLEGNPSSDHLHSTTTEYRTGAGLHCSSNKVKARSAVAAATATASKPAIRSWRVSKANYHYETRWFSVHVRCGTSTLARSGIWDVNGSRQSRKRKVCACITPTANITGDTRNEINSCEEVSAQQRTTSSFRK